MKAVVDTNVLVYDTIGNSPFHKAARDLIDGIEYPIISSISLVEMGFVLPRYGISDVNIKRKLNEIVDGDLFSVSWISRKILTETIEFIVENTLSFKEFNDWIISYDAYSKMVPLMTFDKNLAKKCKNIGIEILEAR